MALPEPTHPWYTIMTIQHCDILIVEDCDEDYDTAMAALHNTGLKHAAQRALTGEKCLALLRGNSGGSALRPDFILLDLSTPGIDGREVLSNIKTDPNLKTIPVVVLTASSNPRDLAACYETGSNAYHVKPVLFPDHVRLLEQIFNYWLQAVRLWKTDTEHMSMKC